MAMNLIKEAVPAYLKDVSKGISFQFEQYKNQERFFMDQDYRATLDLKALLASKYPQETCDALKFLIGVASIHPGAYPEGGSVRLPASNPNRHSEERF